MGYTLAQLRAKVRLRLGSTADDAMLTDAQLNESVNNGLRNFALERDWPWLVTPTTIVTVANTGTYALPANFIHAKGLSVAGGEPLEEVSLNEILRAQRQTSDTYASVFYHDGLSVRLGPKPRSVYTVDLIYVRGENELSTDADTILTPNQYADLVVYMAALDAALPVRDSGLISALRQEIEEKSNKYSTALQRSTNGPRLNTRTDNWL